MVLLTQYISITKVNNIVLFCVFLLLHVYSSFYMDDIEMYVFEFLQNVNH